MQTCILMHRVFRNCINSIFIFLLNLIFIMVLFLRPFSFLLLYCWLIVCTMVWRKFWPFKGDSIVAVSNNLLALLHNWNICCTLLGSGAKNSKQIRTQFYQDSFTNILTKASTTRFCNATADLCCLCLNGQRKKTRYLDGLSLRLIQSVLNHLENNFEKSCQSVNVVNILDVIGKKLFWAGFFGWEQR